MIDFITVVFQSELEILRLQAQSIELYQSDVGVIRVIVNDDSRVDPAWWGKLSDHVVVMPRSDFGNVWSDNGWVSQQALKILGSAANPNEWSVVLDAKTILVKPLALQHKPQVGSLEIYPVFAASQQIINQLFGIDLQQQLGPGGVPFFINNAQARNMIQDIESQTHVDFAEWFQAQGRLTEFMLYSGYLQSKNLTDQLYDTSVSAVHPCNVCHSEVGAWDRKYKEMATATTVSVHRHAWSQLTAAQQKQYMDFLQSRGIH